LALLSVSGACSRAGKTAVAATVLRALSPGETVAVKFTTTEDVFKRCPRGAPCVVCDIDVPYRIVEDEVILREPGTDTARLGEAGARRVIWAIARHTAAPRAWEDVRGRIGDADIVMEGSTVVELAAPDLLVFVVHPFLSPERWKLGSGALIQRADVVLVNRPRGESRAPATAVMDEVARFRAGGEVRVADGAAPLHEWAPDVAERLERLRADRSRGLSRKVP
jgi:hypothetical protein